MAPEWDIAVGQTVRRREEIHGGKGYAPRFGGAWYGGVEPSGMTPNVFIFSEPEAGTLYGYNYDGWAPDGTLHYTGEGKIGDQRIVAGNRAILHHIEDGRTLRVFRANPPFATYLGEFAVDSGDPMLWADGADEEGNLRQVIVFRLHPVGDHIRGDLPEVPDAPTDTVTDVSADTPLQPPPVGTSVDIDPEATHAHTFVMQPSGEPVEHQRREAALVERYKQWLNRQGHPYGRKLITIPEEAGHLYTDLHDYQLDELIEAKASAARGSIRAGLGQLLDYSRFVPASARALLVPTRPRPDLVDLLRSYGCECIWETSAGRFERSD